MKTFDIFEVKACTNPDIMTWPFMYEHVWYFRDETDWILAWKWKWWFWIDAAVKPMKLVIFDSFEEFDTEEKRKKREKALWKLSDEEKKILWL
jgi:hypothetical protein